MACGPRVHRGRERPQVIAVDFVVACQERERLSERLLYRFMPQRRGVISK